MKNTNSSSGSSGHSRNKITSRSFNRGFTLIEMLVVIAIIAILSGIIIANLSGAKQKARDAKRISDLGAIQMALSLIYDRCDQYPGVSNPAIAPELLATLSVCNKNGHLYKVSEFISSIPKPTSEAGQTYYEYKPSNDYTNYIIHARLESSNAATASGLQLVPDDVAPVQFQGGVNLVTCNTPQDYCLGPK